jgi:hypothetical protein
MKPNKSKLLALKVYFLNPDQKISVLNDVSRLPVEVGNYLGEIEKKFPQLEYLTSQQRHVIYEHLLANEPDGDGWEALRAEMESLKQSQVHCPLKLFTLISEEASEK